MVDVRTTDLKTGAVSERDFTPDETAARDAGELEDTRQATADAARVRAEQIDRVDNDPLIKALVDELEAIAPGAAARVKSRI